MATNENCYRDVPHRTGILLQVSWHKSRSASLSSPSSTPAYLMVAQTFPMSPLSSPEAPICSIRIVLLDQHLQQHKGIPVTHHLVVLKILVLVLNSYHLPSWHREPICSCCGFSSQALPSSEAKCEFVSQHSIAV